jgi:type VI secretion system protein ImpG
MSDQLFRYYDKELALLEGLATDFAQEHPKVAAHLKITEDTIEDPHVLRLIQSVAFLNANIRQELDAEYPEFVKSLMEILYPHYLSPIPSMAIAEYEPESTLTEPLEISQHTLVQTLPIKGERIYFRNAYPLTIYPIEISHAKLQGSQYSAPKVPEETRALLHFELRTLNSEVSFSALSPKRLRFFIKGLPQHTYPLYDQLMQHTHSIVLARNTQDEAPIILAKTHLKQVGFLSEEGLLPYSERSHIGYRLLSEFFVFPEKFLFFDVIFPEQLPEDFAQNLHLYFYMSEGKTSLESHIQKDYFSLHASPIVNLFPKTAEPLLIDHTDLSYPIVPDAKAPLFHEIYQVGTVTLMENGKKAMDCPPLYGISHDTSEETARYFVTKRFHPHYQEGKSDAGTDMTISIIDQHLVPSELKNWVLGVQTLCLNRDMPSLLPFGEGEPFLQTVENISGLKNIRALTPPTKTHRPELGKSLSWKLLSHLSMNHLTLAQKEGIVMLKELLHLYDRLHHNHNRQLIDSIISIDVASALRRDPSGRLNTFCQGVAITLTVDEKVYVGSSVYLFGSVLNEFFALHASINQFTELTVLSQNKRKVLGQWQPRSGQYILV